MNPRGQLGKRPGSEFPENPSTVLHDSCYRIYVTQRDFFAYCTSLRLIDAHTGNLFAYPLGGQHGGSVLTFLACAVGIIVLARTGRRPLLVLLTVPFLLNLLAAALGKYPY